MSTIAALPPRSHRTAGAAESRIRVCDVGQIHSTGRMLKGSWGFPNSHYDCLYGFRHCDFDLALARTSGVGMKNSEGFFGRCL